MSFNRVMNDYAKVPMCGFVGNSLDLTSPPAFYLQEREWNLSRRNFVFCSTFILMIMFNWLLMNPLKKDALIPPFMNEVRTKDNLT